MQKQQFNPILLVQFCWEVCIDCSNTHSISVYFMVTIWFVFMIFIYNQLGLFFLHHLISKHQLYVCSRLRLPINLCRIQRPNSPRQKLLWWWWLRSGFCCWNQFSLLFVWILEHFQCGAIFQKHLFFITSYPTSPPWQLKLFYTQLNGSLQPNTSQIWSPAHTGVVIS